MIQQLSNRFQKVIASLLLTVFYVSFLFSAAYGRQMGILNEPAFILSLPLKVESAKLNRLVKSEKGKPEKNIEGPLLKDIQDDAQAPAKPLIGGPTQPEMASFKPAGTDNLVNLFTGDFNYNIPLLDVGGYPVNIFYSGGIGMEQEASWVGLGWNINPGNINRNMRGVPDDFNGDDKLVQTQMIKKNRTMGLTGGFDVEVVGVDNNPFSGSLGLSLGISLNNYQGPAMELGLKGSTSLTIAGKAKGEKNASGLAVGGSLGITASSRNGVTFSPSVSLSAYASNQNSSAELGIGASTSYNSRVGLKAMQISEQMSFNNIEKGKGFAGFNAPLVSSTISFTKPSYIPSIRLPVTNSAYSARFEWGSGVFGVKGSSEYELFKQVAEIASNDMVQTKPLVGFLYMQNAKDNPNAVMDFTRFNDNEITENTPVISVPQYAYDVFSIQGEGTGGSIRAYRNDNGYVRDNFTKSKDKSFSLGADIAPPGHFGGNVAITKTPTTVGEWNVGNELRTSIGFREAEKGWENVYFRNPGETSVLNENQYKNIGGTDLVRFKLGGTATNPIVEPKLEKFSRAGDFIETVSHVASINDRKKRTQVISFLNAAEASVVGLDRNIRSYNTTNVLMGGLLNYENISRVDDIDEYGNPKQMDASHFRRHHHISEIDVTEANGQRYVYGIPVYNIKQKDFTFTTGATTLNDADKDLVGFDENEPYTTSGQLQTGASKDGYVQTTETPAFAHSFLLSGLLSPDYVDVGNNGITEDDLGTAVKFNYTRIKKSDGSLAVSRWRTPIENDVNNFIANFNAGKRSEIRDDKGMISCGERESWYMHSIESKNMIALFTLEDRQDSKGVGDNNTAMNIRTAADELKGINSSDNSAKRLKQIDLYNKSDLKLNGLAKAKPIKTVHFEYSYKLCAIYPANSNQPEIYPGDQTNTNINQQRGKLTLERIYFTYNGQNKINKSQYLFDYGTPGEQSGNPGYKLNASDRWGTYKPVQDENASGHIFSQTQRNADFPYAYQAAYSPTGNLGTTDAAKKTAIDNYASAWMLKKILLPSGGQMEMQYESDDYAFVQDKRAATMMELDGLGNSSDYSKKDNQLYEVLPFGIFEENNYAFIRVPDACASVAEVKARYLQGIKQLAFKLRVQMPNGYEYLTSYANISIDKPGDQNNYGFVASNPNIIWVKLELVDNLSPLSLTAVEFLREQLPGQALDYADVSDETTLSQAVQIFVGMFASLAHAFAKPVALIRGGGKARSIDLSKSYVRLNDPDGHKYGGGYRVKSVRLKDNWQKMSGQYTSEYGQNYNYENTEIFEGKERSISSGVASYEPAMGAEENPFQTMYQVTDRIPLGPASYGSIVLPVADAFFPSPVVGYSKVTVTSIKKGTTTQKSKSGIGKQVSEFYTAKDYPLYYSNTLLDPSADMKDHSSSLTSFFKKSAFDSRAISQGFLVVTNDMHGKMKSQASYPENDDKTPVNYTRNFYKNTGEKENPDGFSFIYGAEGGNIKSNGLMGIDVELMTDTREFMVKSSSTEVQGQINSFPIFGLGPWFPFIWPVFGKSENTYRAVTTTKVVNYHAILDKVIVIDKGSEVSTENMLYDSETGQVVVNKTNNEFNKAIYTTTYPAYWAYSGMGPAYKNIDALYTDVNFYDGKITSNNVPLFSFESGDELYLIDPGVNPTDQCGEKFASDNKTKLWAFDANKTYSSLSNPYMGYLTSLYFIDEHGKPYTKNKVTFKIVRSGKRNMLNSTVCSVVSMVNPIIGNKIKIDNTSKIINSTAVEFREKRQADNDVFKRYHVNYDPVNCVITYDEDCTAPLEININPYTKGLLGAFRGALSMVFYDSRKEKDPNVKTNITSNGFLDGFKLYWDFDLLNNLVPHPDSKWITSSQITKINSIGLELETKDAQNIYTAAKYGFNKTTPFAIASNSRYNEFFNESFEDNDYNAALNEPNISYCVKKDIDFVNVPNSSIVPMEEKQLNAHSGKNALQINSNGIQKVITVTNSIPDDFILKLEPDATKNLFEQGGNFIPLYTQIPFSYPAQWQMNPQFPTEAQSSVYNASCIFDNPSLLLEPPLGPGANPFTFPASNLSASALRYYDVPGNPLPSCFPTGNWSTPGATTQYFNVTQHSDYVFNVGQEDGFINASGPAHQTYFYEKLIISRVSDGTIVDEISGPSLINQPVMNAMTGSSSKSVNLCPGAYKLTFIVFQNRCFGDICLHSYRSFYTCNQIFTGYKSLTTTNGCTYSKPIAATESMINTTFSPSPNQKMLFSAWVRERCITALCPPQNYTNTSVNISFNSQSPTASPALVPTGPVIEGWQKIEGFFTVAPNTTSITLTFNNTSGSPIYVDDIRIHPFNANMKSYVYDPVNLRLTAELDENNYAKFYEYNEEGTLVRTKAETKEGIKTITETRSATQKDIKNFQ